MKVKDTSDVIKIAPSHILHPGLDKVTEGGQRSGNPAQHWETVKAASAFSFRVLLQPGCKWNHVEGGYRRPWPLGTFPKWSAGMSSGYWLPWRKSSTLPRRREGETARRNHRKSTDLLTNSMATGFALRRTLRTAEISLKEHGEAEEVGQTQSRHLL